MGQCLSQSAGTSRTSEAGGGVCEKVKNERYEFTTVPHPVVGQSSQPVPKTESKCADLSPFSSSASDRAFTQPSAAHVMTENFVARDTPSQAAGSCHVDARQLHQHLKQNLDNKIPGAGLSAQQQDQPGMSLAVLSTCVSGTAPSPQGCRRVEPAQVVCAATKDPPKEGTELDADQIVIEQGGCCGPVSYKELTSKDEPNFSEATKVAFERGLAGLPHDVVRFGAPRPANEESRMATVRALRTMGMQECPELDLILKVICRIWQAPAACVTLLDSDHVFICSAEGSMTPAHRPWATAMCPWMLLSPAPSAMAVGDLTADARFSKSLHVAGGTRSYLTSPLVASNGQRLGAICFTDVKPRRFDVGDCRLMNNCAELAIRALESHLNVKKRLGLTSSRKGGARPLGKLRRSGSRPGFAGGGADGTGGGADGGGRHFDDLDMDDGTLMEEYANRVRDLAEVDEALLLLLDTRVAGWAILYASPSWDGLTGVDRVETMGATLNEVMAHVSGDPRVVWEGVEREAAAGKPFVTPRVYCKSNPSITFYLSFRPAASEDLDDQTVTLGVPANVPQVTSSTTSRLFFARLHTTPDPPANSAVNSLAPTSLLTTGRRLPPNIAINPVQGLTEMFEGLVVGQVLGQGSYGTVYHARWHGVDVAIKVQDMHIRNAEERAKAEFEVGLSQRLHHLNVVHTLSHASALLDRSNPSGVLDSDGSNIWHAGLQFAPLGYAVASRLSSAIGPSVRGSTAPDSADNMAMALAMAMEGGPAFIPFFAGDGDGLTAAAAAAAAAAATAAAAAAAAAGSVDGARDQGPSFVDGAQDPLAVAGSSHGGGVSGIVDRLVNGWSPPAGCAAPQTAPASSLAVVSGSHPALVRVALPSGARVSMLRNTQWAGGGGGGGGGDLQPPPIAAILAARDSSRSGSPRCPTTPPSAARASTAAAALPSPTSQASNILLKAGSTIGTPSVPRSICSGTVGGVGAPGGGDGPGDGGARGGGDGGVTLVPFHTLGALAAAGISDPAKLSVAGVDGGCTASAAFARGETASGPSDLLSFGGKGGFGSTLQYSSETRELTAGAAQTLTTTSLSQNAVAKDKPSALEASQQDQQHQSPPSALPSPPPPPEAATDLEPTFGAARKEGGVAAQQQQQQKLPPSQRVEKQPRRPQSMQHQHSGALALSGAYNGMPLLPHIDGAGIGPGFGVINLVSAALERSTTVGAGAGSGGVWEGTRVQSAIGADFSGLSYPLDLRLWMVLEFMDKGSLQDAIDRGWLREGRTADHGPDYPAVLATAQEIAAAVAYLHSHDVVHGDLSAVNVLLQSVQQQGEGSKRSGEPVDSSGRGFIAKISDFGLSMQLTRPDQAIKTGAYGTITHMAPEVLRNSALSKSADVYSIGVLLWQMVTGSRPWAGLSHLQVSVEVATHERQLQWPAWVHGGVKLLGQRCMSPRPEERPTAAQMQAELAELMRQVPQYG